MGEFADDAAALTFIQANKWDSSGDGAGDPQEGMTYYNTTSDQLFLYTGSGWRSLGGGAGYQAFVKAVQFSQAVGATANVSGSTALGLAEGSVYMLKVEVTSGSSDDADIEFGDSSFTGAPNVFYQIGQDTGGSPLWVPSSGDWVDGNAWGFLGLTSGTLYWRITNGAATSATFRVTIRAIGSEVALSV